jgi:hypothetical protein
MGRSSAKHHLDSRSAVVPHNHCSKTNVGSHRFYERHGFVIYYGTSRER